MYQERLHSQARALAQTALAFTRVDRDVTGAQSELPTHDLGHATARLAVVVDRLSEPVALASGADLVERLLVGERPATDTLSVFLFGNQVVDAFARVELARRTKPETDWATLVKLLDQDPRDVMTPGVRYLNLNLVLVRDLLAEHYGPAHYPTTTSSGGADLLLGRVAPPDQAGEPYVAAVAYLRDALGLPAGPITAPAGDYHDLAWRALEESPTLDYRQAGLVRKALSLAGPLTLPVPWIIDWVLHILREHAVRRGIAIGL